MFELTMNEQVYQFNFGMGFMREINKKIGVPVDGLPNVKKNIGLQYYVALVIDKDVEALVDILDTANKGMNPRITRDVLDAYIDDPDTDIDTLFDEVIDFLKQTNATKNVTMDLLEAVEKEKAKKETE
ncbi:MAG: tail assembly chaperone [Blautia sp.]|uniref:tail assembly chaperone n=1 Tax=Blautia sp. TaxID=1955243 RepID=UPI002E7AAD36|nr:tail assembly chaperone [Blautia sp.]MED9882327.1 tail assembly chaperone [Blautia sp.]